MALNFTLIFVFYCSGGVQLVTVHVPSGSQVVQSKCGILFASYVITALALAFPARATASLLIPKNSNNRKLAISNKLNFFIFSLIMISNLSFRAYSGYWVFGIALLSSKKAVKQVVHHHILPLVKPTLNKVFGYPFSFDWLMLHIIWINVNTPLKIFQKKFMFCTILLQYATKTRILECNIFLLKFGTCRLDYKNQIPKNKISNHKSQIPKNKSQRSKLKTQTSKVHLLG